ncbi:hypothetical protein S245_050795, partial [Arachis hypogaea]
VAIDNGETLHTACHGRRLACLKKKTVGKQRFRRWSISKPQPILHYCKTNLQDNHSLLQADNLCGIDPCSRKVLLGRPSTLA